MTNITKEDLEYIIDNIKVNKFFVNISNEHKTLLGFSLEDNTIKNIPSYLTEILKVNEYLPLHPKTLNNIKLAVIEFNENPKHNPYQYLKENMQHYSIYNVEFLSILISIDSNQFSNAKKTIIQLLKDSPNKLEFNNIMNGLFTNTKIPQYKLSPFVDIFNALFSKNELAGENVFFTTKHLNNGEQQAVNFLNAIQKYDYSSTKHLIDFITDKYKTHKILTLKQNTLKVFKIKENIEELPLLNNSKNFVTYTQESNISIEAIKQRTKLPEKHLRTLINHVLIQYLSNLNITLSSYNSEPLLKIIIKDTNQDNVYLKSLFITNIFSYKLKKFINKYPIILKNIQDDFINNNTKNLLHTEIFDVILLNTEKDIVIGNTKTTEKNYSKTKTKI